jgi:uracil-DNA glycosylase
MSQIKLSNSWLKYMRDEFDKEYMKKLKLFLVNEISQKKIIYPAAKNYFRALDLVDVENVKVVILGQDPYHGAGQAHGLSFSVQKGVALPPSLQNIFKELKEDLKIEPPLDGDLTRWAQQGVLLLNSVLTVEQSKAGAHQKKGWEDFTDKIISVVNENCEHVVFILWGAYAQKKAAFVDREKHLVIESVHPSPLSSYRGFFGSKPFSKANAWLKKNGQKPIEW